MSDTPLPAALRPLALLNHWLGRGIAWLTLVMMLAMCAVVVMRYALGANSIALQESITYLHGMVFMLGMAYTWQQDEHVRVDIFYRNWSVQRQALVNLLGTLLFVIPLTIFLLVVSWDYVANSWAIRESSAESSGLPFIWLLKTLLLLMPALLLLQAIVELARSASQLRRGAQP